MNRRDKINYYLDIAEAVSERSTCLRRKFGAIVVQNELQRPRFLLPRTDAGAARPAL